MNYKIFIHELLKYQVKSLFCILFWRDNHEEGHRNYRQSAKEQYVQSGP